MRHKKRLKAAYTVEATGVMATVLLTILILINSAFFIRGKTVGAMKLHQMIEQERHMRTAIQEKVICRQEKDAGWELSITAPVFRPEVSLRQWSLLEEGL